MIAGPTIGFFGLKNRMVRGLVLFSVVPDGRAFETIGQISFLNDLRIASNKAEQPAVSTATLTVTPPAFFKHNSHRERSLNACYRSVSNYVDSVQRVTVISLDLGFSPSIARKNSSIVL